MRQASLSATIEAVLLVSNRPLGLRELADVCEKKISEVEAAVQTLVDAYGQRPETGIQLTRVGNLVQLVTAGVCAPIVQRFLQQETTGELTRAQLETLTIIAYRGPVTRAELEQIRGVNCAIILRNLHIRGLIETQAERAPIPRYLVSMDFLKSLGLPTVERLPDYVRLHGAEVINRLLETTAASNLSHEA